MVKPKPGSAAKPKTAASKSMLKAKPKPTWRSGRHRPSRRRRVCRQRRRVPRTLLQKRRLLWRQRRKWCPWWRFQRETRICKGNNLPFRCKVETAVFRRPEKSCNRRIGFQFCSRTGPGCRAPTVVMWRLPNRIENEIRLQDRISASKWSNEGDDISTNQICHQHIWIGQTNDNINIGKLPGVARSIQNRSNEISPGAATLALRLANVRPRHNLKEGCHQEPNLALISSWILRSGKLMKKNKFY